MPNLKEIQDFLKNLAKTDLHKVKIKTDEIELTVQLKPDVKFTTTTQTIAPQVNYRPEQTIAQPQKDTPKKKTNNDDNGLITIKSPMVGTFYRKPSPDKPNFVEKGQKINSGDIICIVEAMKLFNEIEAEINGEIVDILVEDATPIEFDQPLFLVKP